MTYSISKIANILGLKSTADQNISTLLIDSRSLTEPSVSLFFALKTPNNDGHRYIKDLYSRGVRSFVVNYIPEDMLNVDNANFLEVPSVTQALQAIAQYHRNELVATVIGITGSRGKTIVK
jgi:alanine racemase